MSDLDDASFNIFDLKHVIEEFITKSLWTEAAERKDAIGAEGGADFTMAKKVLQQLQRQGQHSKAGALRCSLAGGQWTQLRMANTDEPAVNTSLCPRCLREPESLLHKYWVCKANDEISDPDVAAAQQFADRAKR